MNGPKLVFLLGSLGACVALDESEPTDLAFASSDPAVFTIRTGIRCVDRSGNVDGRSRYVIRTCGESYTVGEPQRFMPIEVPDDSRDIRLEHRNAPGASPAVLCATVVGPNGPGVGVGHHLESRPCDGSAAQRFAWDGDALMAGYQAAGERVSRDLVLEYKDGDTREGTPVVFATRELDDVEQWGMVPTSLHDRVPHSGFITVETEGALAAALADAKWGSVVTVGGTGRIDIALDTMPMGQVVPAGVTLRGNGVARLHVPELRELPPDSWMFRLEDQARITNLELQGNAWSGGNQTQAQTWAILVGGEPGAPPAYLNRAYVDRVDAWRWTGAAIAVWGDHEDAGRFECPVEPERDTPVAVISHNVIHHNYARYGVLVAAGGSAWVRRNVMFHQGNDVVASFNGYNRYIAEDNLFTGLTGDEDRALLGVTGSCGVDDAHWQGGIAGDLFEVAFNSFLTGRTPTVQVRGTPCDHVEFHDNLSARGEDELQIRKHPQGDGDDCRTDLGPFQPGFDGDILWSYDNRFDVDNPLWGCTNGDCNDGELGVMHRGGFDALFLGTGVTWWRSNGRDGWHFMNRVPERADQVRFGDLDADGIDDVIAVHGGTIDVSWRGQSPWFTINTTMGNTIDDLAVVDFDQDERDDLFLSTGEKWLWSSGGTAAWDHVVKSEYRAHELRFGDLDGDGITDVMAIFDDSWQARFDGPLTVQWKEFGAYPAYVDDLDEIVIGDFDHDGDDDVAWWEDSWIPFTDGAWWFDGDQGREKLRDTDTPIKSLPVGNFFGDSTADVLVWSGSSDRSLSVVEGGRDVRPLSKHTMR